MRTSSTKARRGWTGTGPPRRLERKVRAFDPWPVAEGEIGGERLRIWSAPRSTATRQREAPGTVLAADARGLDVALRRGHPAHHRSPARRRPPHRRSRLVSMRAPTCAADADERTPTTPGPACAPKRRARLPRSCSTASRCARAGRAQPRQRRSARSRAALGQLFAASRWWLRFDAVLSHCWKSHCRQRRARSTPARARIRPDRNHGHARIRRGRGLRRRRAPARPAASCRSGQCGTAPISARTRRHSTRGLIADAADAHGASALVDRRASATRLAARSSKRSSPPTTAKRR